MGSLQGAGIFDTAFWVFKNESSILYLQAFHAEDKGVSAPVWGSGGKSGSGFARVSCDPLLRHQYEAPRPNLVKNPPGP